MLDTEFKYYLDNKETLTEKYPNKYLVIRGEEVVGVYDDRLAAYNEASEKFKIGTFLIQLSQVGSQSYTQTFHTRAIINH